MNTAATLSRSSAIPVSLSTIEARISASSTGAERQILGPLRPELVQGRAHGVFHSPHQADPRIAEGVEISLGQQAAFLGQRRQLALQGIVACQQLEDLGDRDALGDGQPARDRLALSQHRDHAQRRGRRRERILARLEIPIPLEHADREPEQPWMIDHPGIGQVRGDLLEARAARQHHDGLLDAPDRTGPDSH